MIDAHLDELTAVTSTATACGLLGRARATHYRRDSPPMAFSRQKYLASACITSSLGWLPPGASIAATSALDSMPPVLVPARPS